MDKVKNCFRPRVLFFCIFLIGLVFLISSYYMPKYTETNEFQILNKKYYNGNISREQYLTEFTTNNSRNHFMDIGNGLITFSSVVLVCFIALHINDWSDLLNIKAWKKPKIIIIANITLLLLIPGTYFYYSYRAWRGDYPPFADSISIPITYNTIFCLICLIPLNIFLLFALIKSDLQTLIFIKIKKNNWCLRVWECVFGFCFLLLLLFLIMSIIDGDHVSIIGCLCYIYLIASLRAGKIQYYQNKNEQRTL